MKLTIDRATLLKSLAHVQSVVERRNTIPILSNVLIESAQSRLGLTATDMDLTIVEEMDVDAPDDGAITVPAHTLYDIVRKLPDGAEVELTAGGESGQMTLRSGRSTFRLATLPKEDFPATAAGDLPQEFELPAADLKHLVDCTQFAISTEETRYYLNGIYLHAPEDSAAPVLRAVATDGHRLARFEMPLPDGATGMPGVIVPRKAVGELRKLIEDCDEPIKVALSETKVRFSFASTVLTSKLIDGTFPDYQRVIPEGNDKILDVDCRDFTSAVDRVATISMEKSRAVKLALANGSLVLSATSPEAGSATEEIEVNYGADEMEIGFNARYLLDITQQIQGTSARFTLSDSGSPTIVQDAGDDSALYVLMPMRV